MEKRFVYADNAATTSVSERVLEAMLPYMKEQFGNPSSIYMFGQNALRAIETAREKVAAALGCSPSEIYFTGCGSESDNWALKSIAERLSGAKALSQPFLNTLFFTPASILKERLCNLPAC